MTENTQRPTRAPCPLAGVATARTRCSSSARTTSGLCTWSVGSPRSTRSTPWYHTPGLGELPGKTSDSLSSDGQDEGSQAFRGHRSEACYRVEEQDEEPATGIQCSLQSCAASWQLNKSNCLNCQRLSQEEETKKKWTENTLRLHQIITSLKKLILEVGEKSQSSILELLQNPKALWTLKFCAPHTSDERRADTIPSGYQFG